MKLLKLTLLVFLSSFLCFSAAWTSNAEEKIYIPKGAIKLTEDGILIFDKGESLLVDALYSDQNGFYIVSDWWKCDECGKKHHPYTPCPK